MKGSIYTKIKNRTLLMAIIAVAAVTVIAGTGLFIIRQSVMTASNELGDSAAANAKQALIDQTQDSLLRLVESKAALSDEKLYVTASYVKQMSFAATTALGKPFAPEQETFQVLREVLLSNFTSNSRNGMSCYYGTEGGEFIFSDSYGATTAQAFDPRTRPWYMDAKEKDAMIWTDVYDDREGRGLTITCAMPYHYGKDGKIAGVAGVGTFLMDLNEIVIGTKIGRTGHAFLLNELGQIIISETIERDADGKIIRENLLESPDQTMRDVASRMLRGESGIERINVQGVDKFIAFHGLETLPWSIATIIDVNEVIAPALESENQIIDLKQTALGTIDNFILYIALAVGAALVVVILGILLLSGRLAKDITKPILSLTEGAGCIGAGDLEHTLNVKTGDELEMLSDTFNSMISNIKTITADKERIGAELNVATQIQSSMLPCIFPAFPGRSEFDIFASMQPAKEVGGDFYDFFLVDNNTLAVVMADVSGKGVPAALFMVIAKTLIKNNAQYGKTPKEVFEIVNNLLCDHNDAGMFVTAFMGYLDIPTGKFTFVNAGHNPPLLRSESSFDWLKTKAGFVLAGMDDMFYKQQEITLKPGDGLFLYTDGVTEAVNRENDLFSDPKLLETANKYLDCPLKEFTVSIKREIDNFADGAEQADDITMLALRYKGTQPSA